MTPEQRPGTGIRDGADGPGPPRPNLPRPDPPRPDLPRLADGAELAGEFVGAGYREPPLLVYRGDGQVVRLPELLYRTIRALEQCYHTGGHPPEPPGHRLGDPAASRRSFTDRGQVLAAVARTLSEETGRAYAAGHVEFLLDKKLAPLGVTTFSDGSPPEVVKPQPMLSLTWKMTMLSERATWFLAGLFTWLFRTPALVCLVAAIVAAETWMFFDAPIAAAMAQTIQSPGGILLVVLLAIASTGFHEIGHGAACRYGGVAPGVTGCGFYLAWPVFYTDITNTYRLSRGGRLRADLGGVYFNGLFILGLTALYFATGAPLLLVAVLSTSLEAVQQLLPTLRFDGYYIIADLVGIPDLFKYIGPILRRVLLRRPDDGRLAALKRWPQMIITIWVILVIPALFGQLALLAYDFPKIVASDLGGMRSLAAGAMSGGDPVLGVASATVRILLLLFPLVGIALILLRLLRSLVRFAIRRARMLWAARPAATAVPATMQSILEDQSTLEDQSIQEDAGRERSGVPGPRHGRPGRRPGRPAGPVLPLAAGAAVLGVIVIAAWMLAPSLRQGTAADTKPDQTIGTPAAHSRGSSTAPRSPGAGQPGVDQPGIGQPAADQPGVGQPGAGESDAGQPGAGQPGAGGPGSGQSGDGQAGAGLAGSAGGHRPGSSASPSGQQGGGSGAGSPSSGSTLPAGSGGTSGTQPSSAAPSGSYPDGSASGGSAPDGSASGGSASDGSGSGNSAPPQSSGQSQPGVSQSDPGQPSSGQGSSGLPGVSQSDPGQKSSGQPGAGQPGVSQSGAGQGSSAQPGVNQSGPRQGSSGQPGVNQSGAGQGSSGEPGVKQSGPGQGSSGQPGVSQSGSGQASSSQLPSDPSSSAEWTPAPPQFQSSAQPSQAPSVQSGEQSQHAPQPLPMQQSPGRSPVSGDSPSAGFSSSGGFPSSGGSPSSGESSASGESSSSGGSPSQSPGQPSGGPSGSPTPPIQLQPAQSSSCTAEVNLVLLELNGLCPL